MPPPSLVSRGVTEGFINLVCDHGAADRRPHIERFTRVLAAFRHSSASRLLEVLGFEQRPSKTPVQATGESARLSYEFRPEFRSHNLKIRIRLAGTLRAHNDCDRHGS